MILTSNRLSTFIFFLFAVILRAQATDIACPNNLEVECSDLVAVEYDYNAFINAGGTATDTTFGIDEASLIVLNEDEIFENCTTSVVRTYEISNNDGQTASCDHIILVVDKTAPLIQCVDSIIQEEDPGSPGSATVSIDMPTSISDNCNGELTLTNSFNDTDDATDEYPVGETNIVWSVIDDCGNTGTCTTEVVITELLEPAISCPENISIECLIDAPEVYNNWSEFTNAGGSLDNNAIINESSFIIEDEEEDGDDCSGTITRTYSIEDENGSSATCEQLIISNDQTMPVITICPADVTGAIKSGQIDVSIKSIAVLEASDNCGENFTISYNIGDGPVEGDDANGAFPLGETDIEWFVTDACNNIVSGCTTKVTVTESVAPNLICPPVITLECIENIPVALQNTIDFTADGGAISDENNDIDISTFSVSEDVIPEDNCNKQMVRTYSIEDLDGNMANCNTTIIIDDKEAPILITSLDTIKLNNGEDIPQATPSQLSFESNCADIVQVEHLDDVSDEAKCPENIIRTYKATDACGNETLVEQIIVIDCTSNIQFSNFQKISIYPNPFNNYLILDGDLSLLDKAEILDITGKVIMSQNDQLESIKTNNLKAGLYILKVYQDGQSQVMKILKK